MLPWFSFPQQKAVSMTRSWSLSVPLSPSPSRARARSLSGCACRWRRASRRHTASQGSMAQVGVICAGGGWDGNVA
jgi:hypothetical protein